MCILAPHANSDNLHYVIFKEFSSKRGVKVLDFE